MKLLDTLTSTWFWIFFISLILLIFYTYDNKEDFAPIENYPTDPLPSVSSIKYNYINSDDVVNDKFESLYVFNKLQLPNRNINKPIHLMARSNGRVRQSRLIN